MFGSQDFELMVQKPARLTELNLCATDFDLDNWTSIQRETRHLKSLQVVKLAGCHYMTGSVAQEMLYMLPALEVFEAGEITDREMELAGWRPWVCLGLRGLYLRFGLRSTSQQKILSQLGRLSVS